MSFIDISKDHKVNIISIDNQHEILADIVNSIHGRIIKAEKSITLSEINNFLEVLENHFENEERLMKVNRYPGYYSHKLEHDRFYKQILTTIARLDKEKKNLDQKDLEGIRRWFYNHIEINDRKCGRFLSEKGIS